MKKHINLIAALLVCAILLISLSGCAGKSAYDIAVENGFTGSESEWLASLVGKDGVNGKDGEKGPTGDRGLTGLNGKDGKDGTNGKDGKDGTHIVSSHINEKNHLILVMNDGSTVDAGYVGLDRVDIGKEPTLSEDKVCIAPGKVFLLQSNLSYPTWTSSDPKVARIAADGLIFGMDEGTATITATSSDGKTVSCEFTVMDLEYVVNSDGGAVITKYKGSLSTVKIPDTIAGHPVTEIDDWAFYENQSIKKVILPDSVTTINYGAFSTCNNLESIDLGNGLTYLGQSAFSDCTALETITLPESLENWGNAIFYGCSKLKAITIPSKITTIGGSMFDTCSSLESVTMTNVKTIEGWAFYDCESLTNIDLPASLTDIGEAAFENCSSLATVSFGNPNTTYWKNSFDGCIFTPSFDEDGFISVDSTMYTNATSNYRSAPTLENETIVEQLLKGTEVNVIGVNITDGWAKIDIEGNTYYIRWSLLSYDPIENI